MLDHAVEDGVIDRCIGDGRVFHVGGEVDVGEWKQVDVDDRLAVAAGFRDRIDGDGLGRETRRNSVR